MDYAHEHGFSALLGMELSDERPAYGPNDGVSPDFTAPYSPDLEDLVRLHKLARTRRVTTVLEFGTGYSSIILADALDKNRKEIGQTEEFTNLRRNSPFELHIVDGSKEWIEVSASRIPEHLRRYCTFHHSTCSIGTFNGRICHYYDSLPNICPDFIYLDGPAVDQIRGTVRGIHFNHNDRTVLSADIAAIEWLLLPGCFILVDGRTNNARFLRENLQRNWCYSHNPAGDFHTFELREPPLGELNRRQIALCLGADWLRSQEGAA
jgi:hypothetical protein